MKPVPEKRRFLIAAGALLAALPLPSPAQSRMKRVAFFSEGRMETHQPYYDAFREGMRKLGYVEGRNVEINAFWGDDTIKPLRWLASDVIDSRPDVIVTTCAWTTKAAQRATATVPIVFAIGEDPVAGGLVRDLGRPGGNVTGLSQQDVELTGKRLDLLKQALPKLARVGVLYPPDDPGSLRTLEQLKARRRATRNRDRPDRGQRKGQTDPRLREFPEKPRRSPPRPDWRHRQFHQPQTGGRIRTAGPAADDVLRTRIRRRGAG